VCTVNGAVFYYIHYTFLQVCTVNGAVIITSNITASNGVLHIIDRVMAPITSPKTLHDYIMYPDMPKYSFS
jgi:uncharacterized surface protein with fasciclin (FAS1) repeats